MKRLIVLLALLPIPALAEHDHRLDYPRCSKAFVRAWEAWVWGPNAADTSKMPPLPKKRCLTISSNYHAYVCSESDGGCGQGD